MRGTQNFQGAIHPLRKLRALRAAAGGGHRLQPAVPLVRGPEPGRQGVGPLHFSANRQRLFNEDLARVFFERVKYTADWAKLIGDEHFSVDGTLIEAWASQKSFKRKDASGSDDGAPPQGRNPEVDFKGETRRNDTHASTTDADARLFKKAAGDKSRLCHMGHILMDNRHGLVVDVEITHASGTAERQAALKMLQRQKRKAGRLTVGADKGYDCRAFVQGCRKLGITPHVAAKAKHSAIDGTAPSGTKATRPSAGSRPVGGLAKTKLIGHAKLAGQALMCFAAVQPRWRHGHPLGGWWDAHHA
ncbi:transposase-related [Plasmodium yoelii yoelii]|uniref:Transposase-related n=1 Tax=Plasmodium yoelii yoelii TaxID=73239 RepID=Q7R779_PLAYO|nr:transposase-related [Plasmodium yoelii yoelii]